MKCSRCGRELRMEKVSRPVYETRTRSGIGDELRYQADATEQDPAYEGERSAEIMRQAADKFDAIQGQLENCGGSEQNFAEFSTWLKDNLFNKSEQVQTGTEEIEEPCDCPVCTGAY